MTKIFDTKIGEQFILSPNFRGGAPPFRGVDAEMQCMIDRYQKRGLRDERQVASKDLFSVAFFHLLPSTSSGLQSF